MWGRPLAAMGPASELGFRMNILDLIGRSEPLFAADVERHEAALSAAVVGGASW